MYKVEVTRLESGEQAFFDLSQDELNALFPEIFKGGVLKKFSLTFSEYPLPNWNENPNWLEEEIEAAGR